VKRWLSRFLPRLQQQLNVVAGVGGVGALILTLAGFLAGGTAKTVLVITGAAIAGGMVIFGVARAWPARAPSPQQVAGKDRPLGDLASIYPRVPALGIIGAGAVGKTTLKKRLLQLPTSDKEFSQKVTFHVSALLRDRTSYVALLDGRGESYDQQFAIAREADIVLVLVDHNDIETDRSPNPERLNAHHAFGVQVRDYLARRQITKRAVHLLLNKKDLWRAATSPDQQKVRDFFSAEVDLWRAAFGDVVTSAEHSNAVPNDTANLISVINEHWADLQQDEQ
jgi:hypothetical protein